MNRMDSHWFAWGRALFAGAVVVVLVTLGLANIALYSRWHDVEDGVLWNTRTEGLTAIEVAPGSAASAAGRGRGGDPPAGNGRRVRGRGDVLVAVNGEAVQTPAEITELHHRREAGSQLSYSLLRLGTRQALQV